MCYRMDYFVYQVFKKTVSQAMLAGVRQFDVKIHVDKDQPIGTESGFPFLYHHDEVVCSGRGSNCLLGVAEHTRKEPTIGYTSWRHIPAEGEQERRYENRRLIQEYAPRYNRHRRHPATSIERVS